MLFSFSSYLSMHDFIVYSSQFIFHANERDILHCEIMHSLHRVRLARLALARVPLTQRDSAKKARYFRVIGPPRRGGWLESSSWLRSTHRATRPGFLLFFFCFFLFFSFTVGRARCKDSAPSRHMSVHCCGNNERWPLLSTVVVPLLPLTYVHCTNSHLQQRLQYAAARS